MRGSPYFVKKAYIWDSEWPVSQLQTSLPALDTNKASLAKKQKYKSPILISNGDRRGTKRWPALTKNCDTRPNSSLNPTHLVHQNRPEINATDERHKNVIPVAYNGAVLHHTGNGRYMSRQEVDGVISNYASSATFWQDILSPVPIRKYFIHKLYTTNEVRFSTRLSHSCAHTRFIHNSIPVLNFDHHDVEIYALRGSYTQILNSSRVFRTVKNKGNKRVLCTSDIHNRRHRWTQVYGTLLTYLLHGAESFLRS